MNYKKLVYEYSNFPIDGVSFKDISPLLASSEFDNAVKEMGDLVEKPDFWVGIESRGFIFASALSIKFGGGLLLCRKAGKLPGNIITKSYNTEYSTDSLSIKYGKGNVVIVDDVLATGGTMSASIELVRMCGADIIGVCCFIELDFLKGREKFDRNIVTSSLINY